MLRLVLIALLLCMGASSAYADWQNGHLERGTFYWSNGGGDPYTGTLDHALSIGGIEDERVRALIASAVEAAPEGHQIYTIEDGDKLGVMVSGDGWVARSTIAQPSSWKEGRSREAKVWYVVDPETGVQYRIMRATVCGNWILQFYNAPEKCRCVPEKDAC